MFCVNCGAAVEGDALAACATCGKTVQAMISASDVSRMIKEASSDAFSAVRHVAADPIGGLASSYAMLGEQRARSAGIAFGVGFAIIAAMAGLIAASPSAESPIKLILVTFIVALVPFAALAATSAATRKTFRTAGSAGGDLFVAGVALQPIGIFLLLSAILGIGAYQVIALLTLFAWTYMTCILFAGCTRLVGVAERFAPPVMAAMLLVAIWLTKVIASSFLGSGPLARFVN